MFRLYIKAIHSPWRGRSYFVVGVIPLPFLSVPLTGHPLQGAGMSEAVTESPVRVIDSELYPAA